MAINGVTSNYTSRLKDISIFQNPDGSAVGAQNVLPSFGGVGRFCSGIQKLVQRYAVVLLSNAGSQPDYPDFGTKFISTLQAGISPTDQIYASQVFYLANYKTLTTLISYQTDHPEMPADERIVSATLERIALRGGYVSFDVKITSEAGDEVTFLIPLPK